MKFCIEILLHIFTWIPLGMRVLLGRILGYLFSLLKMQGNRVEGHLQLAFPELTDIEHNKLKRKYYRHLGLLVFELLSLPLLKREKVLEICQIEGLEHVRPHLEAGKSVCILASHTGCWELGMSGLCHAIDDFTAHIIVKEIKGKAGNYLAAKVRKNHKSNPIFRRNAIREIAKALKSNCLMGFVLDQNMTIDEGVFVNFFGKPACTMPSLAVLSHRFIAPVIPVAIWRDEDLRTHHVKFYPEIKWEAISENKQKNIVHNTQKYVAMQEKIIRMHPEQWIWMHHRWRTQPREIVEGGNVS